MELAITKDTKDLEKLEQIIQRNIQSFYEVGKALMEIRDRELYRLKNGGNYRTFEQYCKDQWSIARRTAYQFIDSAKVLENVRNCAQVIPATESQTRPLSQIKDPDQQREAWERAVETAPEGKVTAAHVNKVVREYTGENNKKEERKRESHDELISESFMTAWNQLFIEVKNAKALKWRGTSKQAALRKLQILIDVIEL